MNDSAPIRVVFITSCLKAMGGAEKNILDLLHGLDPKRFVCHLIVLQGGALTEKARSEGVRVWDANLKKILSFESLRKGLRLFKFLRKEKIDVVVGYHYDADLWGGFFAKLAGVPAIVSSRRDMGHALTRRHVWTYRLFNQFFTKIVTVSDAVRDGVIEHQWARPDRVVTIYNGVDLAAHAAPIDVRRKRTELGLDPNKKTVGMVANFLPVKSQEYFVQAAASVLRECPNTQFVIVGHTGTAYYQKVAAMIEELGIGASVHCVGARTDVAEILKTFDVFVLSSLSEGFSNAILEAMASRVLVIATRSGGNPEAVLHDKTGLIVAPRDPAELARAIVRVMKDDGLRRSFVESANGLLKRRFTQETMLENVELMFAESRRG